MSMSLQLDNYLLYLKNDIKQLPVNDTSDPVNHPDHYISDTGLESIDVIKAFTADLQGFEAIATANALKYLMRWKNKNGKQDLEKARWYINELLTYLEVKEDLNDE